jgi:hypothetical protein
VLNVMAMPLLVSLAPKISIIIQAHAFQNAQTILEWCFIKMILIEIAWYLLIFLSFHRNNAQMVYFLFLMDCSAWMHAQLTTFYWISSVIPLLHHIHFVPILSARIAIPAVVNALQQIQQTV